MELVPELFVIAMGLAVGSFLNVCIHRLPLRLSLVRPASRCPRCEAPLKAYDNIPVIGYLMLGGKCRSCGLPISVQYPVVEIITAALFLGAYTSFPRRLSISVRCSVAR